MIIKIRGVIIHEKSILLMIPRDSRWGSHFYFVHVITWIKRGFIFKSWNKLLSVCNPCKKKMLIWTSLHVLVAFSRNRCINERFITVCPWAVSLTTGWGGCISKCRASLETPLASKSGISLKTRFWISVKEMPDPKTKQFAA